MRIDPAKTIAMFIDYQERLVPAQFEHERVIATAAKLARGLGILNIPVISTVQYVKGLGPTVADISEIEGFFQPLEKMTFSCMFNDDITSALKKTGAKNIIVCGMETHICVLQTVIDLIEMGYCVFLVEDCCTSRTERNHRIGMERATQEGAFITSLESILFELLQKAGSDTFKQISKLIK